MKKVENIVFLTPAEYNALTRNRRPFMSITAFLFVTLQAAAILWVSASYAIAAYSTVKLGQPFPVETLSQQAIETLLGGIGLKVIANVFEHNDGFIWGHSRKETDPVESTEEF